MNRRFSNVVSPEFGTCQLEVRVANTYKLLRLLTDNEEELAVGVETSFSDVDCELIEDEEYYYLTSYFDKPMKTIRVCKEGLYDLKSWV